MAGPVRTAELVGLFREGAPWFRQSALYALFHILLNAPSVDEATFARYGAMTEAFFSQDHAAMRTSVEAVTRGANAQFAKIAERIDRNERTAVGLAVSSNPSKRICRTPWNTPARPIPRPPFGRF